jgi:hypothetical protein
MNPPRHRWGLCLCTLAALAFPQTAPAQVDARLQGRIDDAVDRGVSFLKKKQSDQGVWRYGTGPAPAAHDIGATALAAWALLESRVPADDPAIKKAAAVLRRAAVTETSNYHLSLLVLFFDKLADPEDVPLIESLGLRLMQSQTPGGGWSYGSRDVPAAEQARLGAAVAGYKGGGKMPRLPRDPGQLDPAIKTQLVQLQAELKARPAAPPRAGASGGDYSNTQFAVVALWVARRYGLPSEGSVARAGKVCQDTQMRDGSWAYAIIPGVRGAAVGTTGGALPSSAHTPAMTCAGLLGLGVGTAAVQPAGARDLKSRLLAADSVRAGFQYLGWVIRNTKQADGNQFYLLWSMERVGVFYGVRDFAGADWYDWGARWLVDRQAGDGSWPAGKYADGHCDTSFALLFLKRANPFHDNPLGPPLPAAILKRSPKGGPK